MHIDIFYWSSLILHQMSATLHLNPNRPSHLSAIPHTGSYYTIFFYFPVFIFYFSCSESVSRVKNSENLMKKVTFGRCENQNAEIIYHTPRNHGLWFSFAVSSRFLRSPPNSVFKTVIRVIWSYADYFRTILWLGLLMRLLKTKLRL